METLKSITKLSSSSLVRSGFASIATQPTLSSDLHNATDQEFECLMLTYSTIPSYTKEKATQNYCPADWDGVLCWPRTAVSEKAVLPCFGELHGIPYNTSGELMNAYKLYAIKTSWKICILYAPWYEIKSKAFPCAFMRGVPFGAMCVMTQLSTFKCTIVLLEVALV